MKWLNCSDRKTARQFRDSYDPFDKDRFCVALLAEKVSAERDSELLT